MQPVHEADRIMERLGVSADVRRLSGMARYGIDTGKAIGLGIPVLRAEARFLRKGHGETQRHDLAQALWDTEIHEARILASMVDAPGLVHEARMERWATAFNSWDLCDQCCNNLFRHAAPAWHMAATWGSLGIDGPEFTVRAGFVLMATLAVGDKQAPDESFLAYFPLVQAGCVDGRNYVKKAVSWALRQIGKRNAVLHKEALDLASWMREQTAPAPRWVGRDVLRDLERSVVVERL
jgi:3-methyladenine DNA glycosylase AlkD